ncbi:MAG: DUF6655 family protein [Pirellulaceae bacterium]|nr:DUF6655 family protein [Pirellulaceae bacterium]
MNDWRRSFGTLPAACGLLAAILLPLAGCGINKSRLATEQLVVSDAVDRAIANIDFGPLSGQRIYFDTKYLDDVKMGNSGNVQYVISSLRQQMAAFDCRLQEKPEDADYVVEARVGVLANDGHEVTFGIPGSAAAMTTSVLLASPALPTPGLPELSVGRRNHQQGTAKIGIFAYDRITREPVWQAGVAKATSRARDYWVFGLGPFEQRSASGSRGTGKIGKSTIGVSNHADVPLAAYESPVVFERAQARRMPAAGSVAADSSAVQPASHAEPAQLGLSAPSQSK